MKSYSEGEIEREIGRVEKLVISGSLLVVCWCILGGGWKMTHLIDIFIFTHTLKLLTSQWKCGIMVSVWKSRKDVFTNE